MIEPNNRPFYTVGSQIYYSKTLALIEATKTNTHPKWHFGDEVFGAVPWSTGTVTDITDLYLLRARQLREKYDYLVLAYSGGSDSRTALESFLSQGLIVDELYVCWPKDICINKHTVSLSLSPENYLSEFELIIKSDLEYIAKHHPEIKISVMDLNESICETTAELVENDWYSVNDHLNPAVFKRFSIMTETEKQMIEAGKKTAIIWGVDKPQLAFKDGGIYFYFLDKLANTRSSDHNNHRTSELFFWTPDLPEIVHAQCRLVYEYFIKNSEKLCLIDWNDRKNNDKNQLNTILKSLLYPNWHPERFQVSKPTSSVWCEFDSWIFKYYRHTRYYQSWEHGLTNIKNVIDQKYYHYDSTGRFNGWTGFVSPMYCLGPAYYPG